MSPGVGEGMGRFAPGENHWYRSLSDKGSMWGSCFLAMPRNPCTASCMPIWLIPCRKKSAKRSCSQRNRRPPDSSAFSYETLSLIVATCLCVWTNQDLRKQQLTSTGFVEGNLDNAQQRLGRPSSPLTSTSALRVSSPQLSTENQSGPINIRRDKRRVVFHTRKC